MRLIDTRRDYKHWKMIDRDLHYATKESPARFFSSRKAMEFSSTSLSFCATVEITLAIKTIIIGVLYKM